MRRTHFPPRSRMRRSVLRIQSALRSAQTVPSFGTESGWKAEAMKKPCRTVKNLRWKPRPETARISAAGAALPVRGRPCFPSARSVPLPAMWGSTGFSAGLVVLPAILPGLVAHALPPWSCGNRIFRRAVGHPCIPALCRFRYEGNTVFFAWACGVACHFARACGTHYAARYRGIFPR